MMNPRRFMHATNLWSRYCPAQTSSTRPGAFSAEMGTGSAQKMRPNQPS
jgi:hypothetical protein